MDLGGYQEATPSGILKAMGVDRLELSHVKSHLQKYRSEKKRSMEKDDDDKDSKKVRSPFFNDPRGCCFGAIVFHSN